MDRWDMVLWAAAAGFCVLALVRLMLRRRNQMDEEVQKQLIEQRKQKEKAELEASLKRKTF
ncbi:MAG TPA: hypothetical protein PLQ00_06915 [Thermoguttaceae bacterium]|nr:hypothetical protein [Thermoguttaceae bacterium]